MKKNEDEITELFRTRLSEHEMPLREDMWNEIESELSKPSSKKFYIAAFIAVAAVFMLLLACSAAVILFAPHKQTYCAEANTSVQSTRPLLIVSPNKVTDKDSELVQPTLITSTQVEKVEAASVEPVTVDVDSALVAQSSDHLSQAIELPVASESIAPKKEANSGWSIGALVSIEPQHQSLTSVGLSISKKLTDKLTLESGLRYSYSSQPIHSIGVPLKLNYTILNKKDVDVYLSAGGIVEKNFSGGGEDSDKLDCAFISSIGMQYKVSSSVALFAESGAAYHFDDHTLSSAEKRNHSLNLTLCCGVKVFY